MSILSAYEFSNQTHAYLVRSVMNGNIRIGSIPWGQCRTSWSDLENVPCIILKGVKGECALQ